MQSNGLGWKSPLLGLCLWCISAAATAAQELPLKVVASIRPLALLVQDIAGNAADVATLVPAGASPHHYSLRVSDMRKVQQADLLVWLGPEFERFLGDVAAARPSHARLNLTHLDELAWPSATDHADHSGRDAHIWLNPDNGKVLLHAIAARLTELRPHLATHFAANLERALANVADATQRVEMQLSPIAERGFGVSHDGFGHFVARFNLRQLAAVSAMPDQGLSARHMMELVKQMGDAQCLLVEAGDAEGPTERLQRLLKVPVVQADPLAVDTTVVSYAAFITALGQSFVRCLAAEK